MPRLRLGVGVAEAFGGQLPGEAALRELAEAYGGEAYWLVWRGAGSSEPASSSSGRGEAAVVLHEGAGGRDVLRALWQAAWLQRHGEAAGRAAVAKSLAALREGFGGFEARAAAAGWAAREVHVALGRSRVRVAELR